MSSAATMSGATAGSAAAAVSAGAAAAGAAAAGAAAAGATVGSGAPEGTTASWPWLAAAFMATRNDSSSLAGRSGDRLGVRDTNDDLGRQSRLAAQWAGRRDVSRDGSKDGSRDESRDGSRDESRDGPRN